MVTFLFSVLAPEKPTTSSPGSLPTLETDEDPCPAEGYTTLEQLGKEHITYVKITNTPH